jgi:hypothetical protein
LIRTASPSSVRVLLIRKSSHPNFQEAGSLVCQKAGTVRSEFHSMTRELVVAYTKRNFWSTCFMAFNCGMDRPAQNRLEYEIRMGHRHARVLVGYDFANEGDQQQRIQNHRF